MAQQKKTDTSEAFAELTEKQQNFVINVTTGMNKAEAYRAAYDAENMSPAAIRVAACRLAQQPNVSLILDALAAEKYDAARLTLEEHLGELDRLSKRAELAGNYGAAVQAQQLRGKAIGLYVERHEDVTETDPVAALERIAEFAPDLAAQLAKSRGIKWTKATEH